MTQTPRGKGSYGPVLVLVLGLALVIVATLGGAVYLLGSSFATMMRVVEERRGPRELLDEDYGVALRVADGEDYELLDGALAASWSGDGIFLLRSPACAAGLAASVVGPDVSLEEALAWHGDAPRITPGPSVAGATETVDVAYGDGPISTTAFLSRGVLYELVGDREPCRTALREGTRLLPGEVHPRRVRPVRDAVGRSYRIRDGRFESAASGLVVDATEPFAPLVEGAAALGEEAELAVLHANGARIWLDPFRRTAAQESALGAEEREREVITVEAGEAPPWRLAREDATRHRYAGLVHAGPLSVWLAADGPSEASVRAALAELAPRLHHLGPPALELLRSELEIHERRSGADWSLRDGTFREHPRAARPACVLYAPRWTTVVAGSELGLAETDPAPIVSIMHRALGVSATVTVAPTEQSEPAAALEALLSGLTLEDAHREPIDATRRGRARGTVRYRGHDGSPMELTAIVQLESGWLFTLEAWHAFPDDADVGRLVDELDQGLVVEPAVPTSEAELYREERLGFALHAPLSSVVSVDAFDADVEAAAGACTDTPQGELCVHATSASSADAALLTALDALDTDRSLGAIWPLRTTEIALDGRTATQRTFWDRGQEVRVVVTSIDRTVYVVVGRGSRQTPWESLFSLVDLDL